MEKDIGYSEPPKYPRPVLVRLGCTYLKLGEFEKAAESINKLLLKYPNSAIGNWGLIQVYEASKQPEKFKEAEQNFNQVTQFGQREVYSKILANI